MKLEYLHDLTANGKFPNVISENLIRLWDFDLTEAKLFYNLIKNFAKNHNVDQLKLHEEGFITPINCNLTLIKDQNNIGISRISEFEFVCKLTNVEYLDMAEFIKPFTTEDLNGYQWLCENATNTDIDFLFSPGGTW